jgi:hypothetical protein
MDKTRNNEKNNLEIDSDVNQSMNTTIGKKRFFNRRLNSEPNDLNSGRIESSKKSSNKWSTSSLNNSNNGLTNDLSEDKFFGDGIQFSAKLIGHEFVAEARGEHMCQQSIKKLKVEFEKNSFFIENNFF